MRILRRSNASALSVRRAEIASDCEYLTLLQRIDAGSPALCNASLRASILSSSDFLGFNPSLGNRILLPPGSCFGLPFRAAPCLLLVYFTSVQGVSDGDRVGIAFAACR